MVPCTRSRGSKPIIGGGVCVGMWLLVGGVLGCALHCAGCCSCSVCCCLAGFVHCLGCFGLVLAVVFCALHCVLFGLGLEGLMEKWVVCGCLVAVGVCVCGCCCVVGGGSSRVVVVDDDALGCGCLGGAIDGVVCGWVVHFIVLVVVVVVAAVVWLVLCTVLGALVLCWQL